MRDVDSLATDMPWPVMYWAAGITARPMARTAMQIGSKSPPIALPQAAEVLSISAAATTSSSENSLANNSASVTPSLINYSVAVQDGDLGHNSHCTGQGLTSYFECELFPSSLSAHDVVFHGDGTLTFVDAPPEYTGVWSQDSGDSLAFTYYEDGVPIAEFVGYGTNPGCFEGVTEFLGSLYVAPYEVCL